MEAVKIITLPPSENPASAAPLSTSAASRRNNTEIKCGAARATAARAGLTYEGALRRKLRLDLLSWGDLKCKAQALIEADHEDINVSLLQ